MKKIIWESLVLEITRRCQLKCAHCMQGDAQDVDMPKEVVDNIMSQTSGIGELLFSGGEPLCNIGMINYCLEQIKNNNITLNKIIIITNGCEKSESFCSVIKDIYDYLEYDPERGTYSIEIKISMDRYHEVEKAEQGYEFYKAAFVEYPLIQVCKYYAGNYPHAIGRAEGLNGAIPRLLPVRLRRIEMVGSGIKCFCPLRSVYHVDSDEIVGITCGVYITAIGNIHHIGNTNASYDELDKYMNNIMKGNILDVITQYNRYAVSCFEYELDKEKKATEIENKYMLSNAVRYLADRNTIQKVKEEVGAFAKMVNESLEAIRIDGKKEYQFNEQEVRDVYQEWLNYCEQEYFLGNDEALKIHRNNPKYTYKECITLANSHKQIKRYINDTTDFGRNIVKKHRNIIKQIEDKYVRDKSINIQTKRC